MLEMRNALLSPVSSQLYSFGNNEVQMPNLDFSMPLDGKGNVHGTGFYLDSIAFSDGNQLRGAGFAFPYKPLINYTQPGYQSTSSKCDDISQQPVLLSKMVNAPEIEMDLEAMPLRKRSNDLVGSKTALTGWKINKRKKVTSSPEEQWHLQVKEPIHIQEHKVPVRRSQRLSDKITALQKLVSPYGKTDTASVLQEASLYIRLLQEQIQNLFQMLSSSDNTANPLHYLQSQEIDGEMLDLKGKGFCLVPMSITEKLTAGRPC